jgi:preprotein translocase subunit SecF
MAHLRYFVFDEQSNWKIDFNGKIYGNFRSEQEAVSKAIEEAFSKSMSGHKAEILIRDKATGQFKLAWSYGRSRH